MWKTAPGWFLLCTVAAAQTSLQFRAAPHPDLPSWMAFMLPTDIDGDGDQDLVLTTGGLPHIYVYTNDGLGSLTETWRLIPAPVYSASTIKVVPIDFDGDGDLDLFATWMGPNNSVTLFVNNGGTWTYPTFLLPVIQEFNAMTVVDLDGDGDQDIAGAVYPAFGIGGMLINQNGTGFTYQQAFGTGYSIAAADIDGDGDIDIAVGGLPLRLYRNDGNLTFTDISAQLPAPQQWEHVAFGDVDNDGDQDLVTADYYTSNRLLRNNGLGTFVEVPGAVPPPQNDIYSLALADVDADGDLDLVSSGSHSEPTLCLNDGTGMFTVATTRWPSLGDNGSTCIIDLDRDGDVDVVTATGIAIWNYHSQLTVSAPPAIGHNWTVDVWGQPGYGAGNRLALLGLGLGRFAQPLALQPYGALWLDVGLPHLFTTAVITPGASPAQFTFPVPPVPAIIGVVLHVQALVEDHAGAGDVHLTSPVSARIW